MWFSFFLLSLLSISFAILFIIIEKIVKIKNFEDISPFHILFISVFFAAFFMFMPIHIVKTNCGVLHSILLSIFNSMQVFTIGTEYSVVSDSMVFCPDNLDFIYQMWASIIYVLAPMLTFGFLLSLFKNLSSLIKFLFVYFKDVYIFSELNEKSISLANDIKENNNNSAIIFTDVFEDDKESSYELIEKAKKIRAICFKKDILAIPFWRHSKQRNISFFTIGNNETENLNQTLQLIKVYNNRDLTHIYVFSTHIQSELLLNATDIGKVKVRRVNEVKSLINLLLYNHGKVIFDNAHLQSDGTKNISAVVVGMGNHGTEMVKALAWYCQMDGYRINITAFDKDELAEDKFIALAPELMSCIYNGVFIDGEAQYTISINSNVDVETNSFAKTIEGLLDTSYVFISLGDDDLNIKTAINVRMLLERHGCHPAIHAVVANSQQKEALEGIKNYRGQPYDIEFIGDIKSSFTEDVIIDSQLEKEALRCHLAWEEAKENEFWDYEYNYRSSISSAIHIKARYECGIPGADKRNEKLTDEEKLIIEWIEHRRWNAYMRSEGYVYSGSKNPSSRNDLAKMHNNLICYSDLSDEDKRKDSRIGTLK